MSKDLGQKIQDAGKNVRDTIDEGLHKGAADAERARRETDDGTMTTEDKVASGLNEAKHRTEGGIDHLKRDVRDHT